MGSMVTCGISNVVVVAVVVVDLAGAHHHHLVRGLRAGSHNSGIEQHLSGNCQIPNTHRNLLIKQMRFDEPLSTYFIDYIHYPLDRSHCN